MFLTLPKPLPKPVVVRVKTSARNLVCDVSRRRPFRRRAEDPLVRHLVISGGVSRTFERDIRATFFRHII